MMPDSCLSRSEVGRCGAGAFEGETDDNGAASYSVGGRFTRDLQFAIELQLVA